MPLEPLPIGATPALDDSAAAPPAALAGLSKEDLEDRLDRAGDRLRRLQPALYAESRQALLIVLQARDAGGKDGVVRHVIGKFNPMGVAITSFKVPTPLEQAHDFLWRVHAAMPPKGMVGVFNRSHYEDVLVVRVHHLVPERVWRPRYDQINGFERFLTGNGVTILKFLLHVSREEQRERLLARLDDPEKNWKFNANDLKERERWDDYTRAYADALARTNTEWARWYVVPADRKRARDVLVAEAVADALERMHPAFPSAPPEAAALRAMLQKQ
ncbi:MAG TPA: PPK2 family polyphosphate kinase [Gemmatimonadales bacterium]|nr:PPK2 family polyphosphate kinase [Gemmatimonadales bacterium]